MEIYQCNISTNCLTGTEDTLTQRRRVQKSGKIVFMTPGTKPQTIFSTTALQLKRVSVSLSSEPTNILDVCQKQTDLC